MENNANPFNEEKAEQENIENVQNAQEIDNKEENKEQNKEQEQAAPTQEEEQKIDEYKVKYEELNNSYIRLAADFENFRKRTLQEKEELATFATIAVLKKIAAVLDTFDRAKDQLKEIEDCKVVKDSYEVAYKQLIDTLNKIGMQEIEALGKEFNANEHEAITQIPTDEYEPDMVAVVAQKGYKLNDKIIRPALVGVAKKKENE